MLRRSWSLGVTIDSHLQFDCHVKEVARACNYHTRALRHVRTLLADDLAQTVACSIVSSRLDYCNAMLYGAPAATFDVLQRAQNNIARVVCQRGGRTDTRPLLRSLHWLPAKHRVTYKMAALTFKTVSSTPAYLNDLIQITVPVCPLQSSDAPLLIVPRTRTEFARLSFFGRGSAHLDSLPSDVRSCRTVALWHSAVLFRQSEPDATSASVSSDFMALYKYCYYYYWLIKSRLTSNNACDTDHCQCLCLLLWWSCC